MAALAAGVLTLAACATNRASDTSAPAPLAAAPVGKVTASSLGPTAAPPSGQAAPVDMTGRWLFAAPGSGQCAMTFATDAGSAEGTIAPEGGCPGNFFTSRKWALHQGGLVIRDHNGAPIAQLASDGPSRFQGRSLTGEAVSLTR